MSFSFSNFFFEGKEPFREAFIQLAVNTAWAAIQGKKGSIAPGFRKLNRTNTKEVEWDDSGFELVDTESIFHRQQEYLKTKDGMMFKTPG